MDISYVVLPHTVDPDMLDFHGLFGVTCYALNLINLPVLP